MSIYIIDTKYWEYLKLDKGKIISNYNSIGYEIKKTLDKKEIINYHIYINDIESHLVWLKLNNNRFYIKLLIIWCELILIIKNENLIKILFTLTGILIMNLQIQKYQPTVIWNMDPKNILHKYIKTIKKQSFYYIAHISTTLPKISELKKYHLLLSSHYGYITNWISLGLNAYEFKTAINLDNLKPKKWSNRKLDLVFIGSITKYHLKRIELLTRIAQEFNIHIYGYGFEYLDENNILKSKWKGYASGDRLYDIYSDSKIIINSHIDLASNIAGNQRLVEATGSGCLLMTENAVNIGNYFSSDEVVTYNGIEDLIQKINIYVKNEDKSQGIASAGYLKTVKQHTYDNRIKEILRFLPKI